MADQNAENAKADIVFDDGSRPIPGYPNLRAFSSEVARENGRKGGYRAAEARRERKTLRESINLFLSAQLQPSHPKYAEIVKALRASGFLGMDEKPTNQHMIIYGLGQRATKDAAAFIALRDTAGEKPIERYEDVGEPPPPVIIGFHDAAFIEAERKRQAIEVEEIRRANETAAEIGMEAHAPTGEKPATAPAAPSESTAPSVPPAPAEAHDSADNGPTGAPPVKSDQEPPATSEAPVEAPVETTAPTAEEKPIIRPSQLRKMQEMERQNNATPQTAPAFPERKFVSIPSGINRHR